MIKKSLSKWLFLATMTIHEEPPRWFRTIQKTKALAGGINAIRSTGTVTQSCICGGTGWFDYQAVIRYQDAANGSSKIARQGYRIDTPGNDPLHQSS